MQPGDLISGKYRLVRHIGDGGMGTVFEARHEFLGTQVALKFLHPELARRQGLASRFLQEAKVSASIQSPHVTRVTDVDQTPEGAPYLVMELLKGESLQQYLDRRHKLPQAQAVDFALQIAAGLEAAHGIGVVHRDLKPDNVFITPVGGGPLLKLLDFGIAKLKTGEYQKGLTRPGAIMGTPEYMAPEQLYAADQVDHRADLFSLGAILYEMLTGHRPAYGTDPSAIVAQIATGQVRRLTTLEPSVPEGLADVVHRAIAADRNHRFASAADLRVALLRFASDLSHAGRLAAQPTSSPVEGAATAPDQPPLQSEKGGVAPTLPPEDEPAPEPRRRLEPTAPHQAAPPGAKGATVEAPKDLLRHITSATPGAPAYGAAYGGPPHGAAPPHGAPPPHGTPPPHPSAFGPPPRRRRRSPWGAILGLVLGLAVTGGAIALIVTQRQRSDDDSGGVVDLTPTAPTTTLTAQGGTPEPTRPTELPPEEPAPAPAPAPAPRPARPTPAPKPNVQDAGAPSTSDAGAADAGAAPFPNLTLPSAIPLPSGFPSSFPTALPSGFPQIPGFPPPAPAPTTQPGSG